MQFWPAAQKAPETQVSAAHSMSASCHTMTGELEPSSMPIFLRPGLGDDALAGLDAAGEADHAHPWVGHQGIAEHGAVTGQALKDARAADRLRQRLRSA